MTFPAARGFALTESFQNKKLLRERKAASGLQAIKIKLVQILERLFFLLGQWQLDRLAGLFAVDAPALAQVLTNMPFLLWAESTEGTPEKDQRPLELIVVERLNVGPQLLPQR